MPEGVKYGTYAATLAAADWSHILVALGSACDAYREMGLPNTLDAYERTLDKLREQVLEPACPYGHAHTKHWCGYEGCRDA